MLAADGTGVCPFLFCPSTVPNTTATTTITNTRRRKTPNRLRFANHEKNLLLLVVASPSAESESTTSPCGTLSIWATLSLNRRFSSRICVRSSFSTNLASSTGGIDTVLSPPLSHNAPFFVLLEAPHESGLLESLFAFHRKLFLSSTLLVDPATKL